MIKKIIPHYIDPHCPLCLNTEIDGDQCMQCGTSLKLKNGEWSCKIEGDELIEIILPCCIERTRIARSCGVFDCAKCEMEITATIIEKNKIITKVRDKYDCQYIYSIIYQPTTEIGCQVKYINEFGTLYLGEQVKDISQIKKTFTNLFLKLEKMVDAVEHVWNSI